MQSQIEVFFNHQSSFIIYDIRLEGSFIQVPYNDMHKLTVFYSGNKWIENKQKKWESTFRLCLKVNFDADAYFLFLDVS